ncbi:MAG: hypothetical protein LC676_06150 [Loktanella sp.]|nr:hypothetical protein [Loktanella sp.]
MRVLKALTACAAFLAATAGPAMAQELSPAQVRGAAEQLLRDGQVEDAAALADALLLRNPEDVTALAIRAQTLLAMDDPAGAYTLAARAYAGSADDRSRFIAARLAAQAQAEQRHDLRAQFWLRRARQFAPTEETRAAVARDYRFLRDRNPVSLSLSFGVTPTSNINNGSVNQTLNLFGLPFEFELDRAGQPIAGLQVSGGASFSYRLREDAESQTTALAQISGRTYVIAPADRSELEDERDASIAVCEDRDSAESRADCIDGVKSVPQGSDFSDASLRFGLIHRQIFADGMRPTVFRYSLGRSFYGGDPYTDFADASVSQSWLVSPRNLLELSVAGQNRLGLAGQDDVISYRVSGSWAHVLDGGDVLRFSLGMRENKSDALDSDYSARQVGVSYDLSEEWNGIKFGFGLDYEEREHAATIYQPGERRDETVSGRVNMQFTQVEYYGFQPVVTLEGTRSTSNVDLFDRDYLQLGFDLRSSF